jgi:FixJ family two-component response regulator
MSNENVITASVVDDEKVIASTVAMILNMSGFNASDYSSAQDALVAAAELGPPQLLITDVSMPGMNGIDLAIQFKALYPTCKVLLFSGQASTSDLLEMARNDGHDFKVLAKPVHPKELLAAITKL